MKTKKEFFYGTILGVILVIVLNTFVTNLNLVYRRFISKELTYKQKMQEIQRVINKYYVNEYDKKILEEGIYKGMVASLQDPYSYYMTDREFKQFLQDTEGNYVGIGIIVSLSENEKMHINKVFENSPAEESGILVDDKIIKVAGEDVNLNNYQDLVSNIKGEEGTKINLTIYRESEDKTFDVDVTRKSIDVPTVSFKKLQDNIGYISIAQFDRVTYDQFKEAFDSLAYTKGLIIDLRNNPGGLLTTVAEITDMLVPKGIITYIEDKNGKREYHYSNDNYYNKPLAILINGNSASASEVLSGAVKDYGIGKLVGETTFGKGVVQNIYNLSDGSGMKVTIAKYYTPKGICIDGTGIEPDVKVKNPKNSSLDLQLEKAIEVINNW